MYRYDKYIVKEDLTIEAILDPKGISYPPPKTFISKISLKKDDILAYVRIDIGGLTHQENFYCFSTVLTLKAPYISPILKFWLGGIEQAHFIRKYLEPINTPELDLPFHILPTLFSNQYLNRKIIEWRLQKGV